jgi:crotonobetainyl-CoA:carnitine CoA-transferase CaiB-like acyl-CoA transferase
LGNAHPNIAPYEAFSARDGSFVVGAANERLWGLLCDVLGRPDLRADSRFSTNADRVANRDTLIEELNEAFSQRDAEEWLADLVKAGLPCGRINAIPEVFAHPQAQAREMTLECQHPTAGPVRLPGFPYKLAQTPAEIRRPPPTLGEHTEDVLTGLLDYSPEAVRSLREKGAI